MARKRSYAPDQTITKLREAEILLSQDKTVKEAQVLIDMWRRHYNTIRLHSSLGYRPTVPAAVLVQPTQIQPVGLS